MTYQVNITVESSRPKDALVADIQAALGSWGIDSANAVVQPANPLEQIVAEFAENLRRVVEKDAAEGEEFCRRVKKIVDDYCYRNC